MSTCEFCLIVDNKVEAEDLYEDDICRAVLHLKPVAAGQILIFPKNHYSILEQVPDEIVKHLFVVANKLGTALFDSLNIQGTNMLVQNGVAAGQSVAHFSINIVPRSEEDGLGLEWQPKQASPQELDAAHKAIKDTLEGGTAPEEKKPVTSKPGEINYLIERLKRIP